MSELLGEIGLVLAFILIGAIFNASEIAMISLRESQIARLAVTRGVRGQRLARLVSDPNRFLASVQIGVTVATMLSSALGAATVSERVAAFLVERGLSAGAASTVGLIGVTLIISFFSLVLGELAPKRLGLQRSESIALIAAGPISAMARLFRPVVWLLGKSTNVIVRLFRGDPKAGGVVITPEELRSLVTAHEGLTTVERRMITDVFDAEDTLVREVMVPRREVEFLPGAISVSRAARLASAHPHSRFPVIGRDADDVIGVVHIRDLLLPSHPLGRAASVNDVATSVTVIPGTNNVLNALHEMRRAGEHLAVVVDEYGGTDGIVTLEDLIEEIAGEMTGPSESVDEPSETAQDGRLELDGRINLDDFAEATGLELPPGPYDTAAGYLMARLGRLPEVGDRMVIDGRLLLVAEMDGRRVSRIDVTIRATDTGPGSADRPAADPVATPAGRRNGRPPAAGPSSPAGPGPWAATGGRPTGADVIASAAVAAATIDDPSPAAPAGSTRGV